MSTNFTQVGSKVFITDSKDGKVSDQLEAGFYTVSYNEMTGYFLETREGFSLPEKVYGSCDSMSDRFMTTFNAREKNTGVLLCGDKGNGKSLLAKQTCIKAVESGMPVILVEAAFKSKPFVDLLASIQQKCVIFIDEFEKLYSKREDQEIFLPLLDGVHDNQLLTILTANNSYRLSEYLLNRPGRIFYKINFEDIDLEAVSEYLDDNLINKEYKDSVLTYFKIKSSLNFDMLISIVEEMNRYNEPLSTFGKMLNISNSSGHYSRFQVKSILDPDGVDITNSISNPNRKILFDPFDGRSEFDIYMNDYTYKNELNIRLDFSGDDLVDVNTKEQIFTLKNGQDFTVTIERAPTSPDNFDIYSRLV